MIFTLCEARRTNFVDTWDTFCFLTGTRHTIPTKATHQQCACLRLLQCIQPTSAAIIIQTCTHGYNTRNHIHHSNATIIIQRQAHLYNKRRAYLRYQNKPSNIKRDHRNNMGLLEELTLKLDEHQASDKNIYQARFTTSRRKRGAPSSIQSCTQQSYWTPGTQQPQSYKDTLTKGQPPPKHCTVRESNSSHRHRCCVQQQAGKTQATPPPKAGANIQKQHIPDSTLHTAPLQQPTVQTDSTTFKRPLVR